MADGRPGRPKGLPKTGGRVKGSVSKHLGRIAQLAERLHVDVFEVLILTAGNRIECGTCRGTGKTKFQPGAGSERFSGERTCQSCWGSKLERISPKERAWAAAEVAQYIEAKRKSVEVTGENGGPVDHKMEIVFVRPEAK